MASSAPNEFELQSKDEDNKDNKIDTVDGKGGEEGEEEENERGNWGNHLEFLLSCVGYAVGLGNVWRFPYQCYKNGGGTFLVVYWMLSALVGFPLVFLEQSIGQYTSQGPMSCWKYAPLVRGIGFSMVAMSAIACIYYNVIIAWSIFMLFGSFQSPLPFAECHSEWANFRCELQHCNITNVLGDGIDFGTDGLCYNKTFMSDIDPKSIKTNVDCPNSTTIDFAITDSVSCFSFLNDSVAKAARNTSSVIGFWDQPIAHKHKVDPQLSTDQYFHHVVLGLYDDSFTTDNIGQPGWGLTLCLLLAWIVVWACLIKGIQSSGKVVYFTAIFPYVVIIILIGRGVTLEGAYDGIMFFVTPDWNKIREPTVWFAAANQLFYSMGGTWGGMIALASYNRFNNNVLRDPMISAFMDSFTSFIAGFAIFSVIGHGAHILGKPVDQVATAGTGLAFVMYPKILLALPGSVAWSIIFFLMILFLALDSQFNMMETVLTALLDLFPYFRGTTFRKAGFVGGLCIFFFILGIPMVCNGGVYLTTAVDLYSSSYGAFCIGIIELLSITWIYGSKNYSQDLKLMLGSFWKKAGYYYITIFWGVISPGIVVAILIYSSITYKPLGSFPSDEILGWMCASFVIIWIPALAVYEIVTAKCGGSFLDRVRYLTKPAKEWGPFMVRDRRMVTHLGPDFEIDPTGKLEKQRRKKAKKSKAKTNKAYVGDSGENVEKL